MFNELLGVSYRIHDDLNKAHLNYSKLKEGSGIQCVPYGLLDESEIRNSILNEIEFESWNDSSYCFKTGTEDSVLPFDIFSAIFFLISRYEEYLDFTPDHHSRFPATESVLFKNNLLQEPLVNEWIMTLKSILINHFPELSFKETEFEYRSTIDIDQAWKFRNKGFIRNFVGTIQDLLQGKWENLKDRWPVLLGLKSDPFFNFEWQNEVHSEFNTNVNYFILLGNRSKFDKNVSHTNSNFKSLIRRLNLAENCTVGIHPSYQSNDNKSLVNVEIKRLKTILESAVTTSRQHFLMHQMPQTYEVLIKNGIVEEHTMGYSTHLGFRAGIASPFYFYNLKTESETSLRLVPFCAMDITPLHYRNESPEQAIKTLTNLMDKVRKVNGLFVSLWHNESFSETERWKGWRKVYVSLLNNSH
ncbi:MAG: polysaccharide deacetylase family protein [Bacteroidia bacterium]|nr:polysaccharide deacetylase family protein [Bacteroidia bacterium]